jgi:predicted hydrocarbon binding protein
MEYREFVQQWVENLMASSDTYCACSLGWMKETFEAVMGRPVDVTLVEPVKRGGQRCQFMIQL